MLAAIWHHFVERDGVTARMIRRGFGQANDDVI